MKRVIYATISLLGFGALSCESGGNLDAYGVPHKEYRVSARVVDTEGKPIEGIEVSATHDHGSLPRAKTNYDGRVEVEYYDKLHTLHLEDVDGELNGGEFTSLDLTIEEYSSEGRHHTADLGEVTMNRK